MLAIHLGVKVIRNLVFLFLKSIFLSPTSMVTCSYYYTSGIFFLLFYDQCPPGNELLSITELLVTKYVHIYGLIFPTATLLL